jgi:hypothetical protein
MHFIHALVKRSPLYRSSLYYPLTACRRWLLDRDAIQRWEAQDRLPPLPHAVKQETVRKYGRSNRLRTLIETGTLMGQMVFAMRNDFERIYSIELEPTLHANAQQRLRRFRHVSILQGDSATVLPEIVNQLTGPALFWLDGHYSGGITAKGALNTPIRRELEIVLGSSRHRHVILVDDAHCFIGKDDYPSIDDVAALAIAFRRDAQVSVADNIIRIV